MPDSGFQGKVNGVVLDLVVGSDGAVLGPSGPVGEPIVHPAYTPALGLTVAHSGSQRVVSAKPPEAPTHAGLVLKARDTGRLLMIQRSHKDEKDPARGRWEFPGGKLEKGDHNTLHGAMREWAEEVGQKVPAGGVVAHTWTSPSGGYQGHVMVIPSEDAVALHEGRVVVNPDDPDGDDAEQAAWWDPDHAKKNPALRDEVKSSPWKEIKMASRYSAASANRAVLGLGPDSLDLPGAYGPGTEEFGDLGFPQAVDETVDNDPEHALPVTYGDELEPVHAARDPHRWLLASKEDHELAATARAYLDKTALRDFSRAEQETIISEGEGVMAGNADRLDLAGTHYLPTEYEEFGWGI
jgi:8-oxo-dGTP pyrophosphatase MutT (NUDIX family)